MVTEAVKTEPEKAEQYPRLNEALMWPARAKNIVIVDHATYNEMAGLKLNLAGFRKTIVEEFQPMKEAAHKAHKAVCDKENEHLKPIVEAEAIAVAAIKKWSDEQERIRQAEQRRLEAEARAREAEDRRRREEEARAARAEDERIAAELRAQDEAARLAAFEEAQVIGASEETLAVILDTPVIDVPEVAPIAAYADPVAWVPPPIAPPTFERAKGLGITRTWSAELISIRQLCRAVIENKVPETYVLANMVALNNRARTDKTAFSIPGVRAIQK